jgi:hypothetical protein
MSTSPSSATSLSISKSEYYSSLPWFRRWLAMLNWRPVVDYELREIEFKKRKIKYEQRMKQLDELNSKIDALLFSSGTSSIPPQNTPNSSEGRSASCSNTADSTEHFSPATAMSNSWGPLPSINRCMQVFFVSLPLWRRP